jgi:UDP-N-acetylglucosamine 2-epimerase (non-hydrolysing)
MTILICVGTRPEYIKVKSLIENLSNVQIVFTGQHQDLVKNINPTYTLNIQNKTNNRLNDIISSIMDNSYIFKNVSHVLVQGDTTSALAMAVSAYNNEKKVIHLEAGLRTHNIMDPYPEEGNRQLISRIATMHLCPTIENKKNLLNEKVSGEIYVTGNTGLDNINKDGCYYGNKVLITMHRRDNHLNMDKWFIELSKCAKKYPNLNFIIPLHPNPNVQKHKYLLKHIEIIEDMNHLDLINLLKICRFVITDSGGIQEEAAFLNKKVIICRKSTERVESCINIKNNKNVSNHGILCDNVINLSKHVDSIYENYIIEEECPYGDGKAWINIVDILRSI